MTKHKTTDLTQETPNFESYELAFLGSLLPGIIHNMATPLSGVLGAAQLLESRSNTIHDLIKSKDVGLESARRELESQLERNRTNVDILGRNANHLADLLQILVQRINRGGLQVRDNYSLNDLLQNEVRFLEANLQFKHRVRKKIQLAACVPAATFVYGHVAAVLDEFVGYAISLHDLAQGTMEMNFTTDSDDIHIMLDVEANYRPGAKVPDDPGLLDLLMARLREDGWRANLDAKTNSLTLSLVCPRRRPTP